MSYWTKKRAQDALVRRLRARYQQIDPAPEGRGLFNFRCHENCVEAVRLEPEDGRKLTICEAIYVDDGIPILHYLLRDQDGNYLDPTLGWRCRQLEFYIIRDLLPGDHHRIFAEFDRGLKDWLEEFVHPVARFLFNIDRIL